MNKRIILVGPTCSGKTFIRDKFREKGYKIDVSYTSRPPREGEKNGWDYNFIGDEFPFRISQNEFYEYVQYGSYWYGTGMREWHSSEIFIMETDGIKHINTEDRKDSLVIYVNTPLVIRIKRMKERGWDVSQRMKLTEFGL
jgi:guanylate kinase